MRIKSLLMSKESTKYNSEILQTILKNIKYKWLDIFMSL